MNIQINNNIHILRNYYVVVQFIYKWTKIRKEDLAIKIYVCLLDINGFNSIKYIKAQLKHNGVSAGVAK